MAIYELIYTSTFIDGTHIKASGLAYVPQQSTGTAPLISYNHGTEIEKERKLEVAGETGICISYAADGYAVLSPDYFGMAKGEGKLLYMHLATEAQCGYDLIKAGEQFFSQINFTISHQLFLTGYSQGAHASMALLKMLEAEPIEGFTLSGASPMSGPYNLEFTVLQGGERKYAYPSFFMMLLKTYNELVNNKPDICNLLRSPYDSLVPPVMDGKHSLEHINTFLPDTPFRALKPDFVWSLKTDSNNTFRQFLRENSLHHFYTHAPLQLCYCEGDKISNKGNTLQYYQYLSEQKKKNVVLKSAGKKFNHWHCAYFAIVYTKMYFDSMRSDKAPAKNLGSKKAALALGKLFVKK